jgi:hypothetical protein
MAQLAIRALICLFAFGALMPVLAQAIVERAIIGAGSSTAAAGVKGVGGATAGVFDALKKTLDGAKNQDQPAKPSPVQKAIVELPAAMQPKDVSGISIGLTREEVINKYGQPALKTTEPGHDVLVENYTYLQTKGESAIVTLRDGVVSAKSTRQSSSVVTLR